MAYPPIYSGQEIDADLLAELLPLEVIKLVDESRESTATMANDAELFLPVEANAKYAVRGYIIYSQNQGATSTTGINLGWSGPTGATMQWTSGGTNGPTSLTGQDVTSQPITAVRGLPANFTTRMSAIPFGTLKTSTTAGNLRVRWAQIAANATPTILHADSWISLRRLA